MTSIPVIWNSTAGQKRRGPLAPTKPDELERVLTEAGVEARIVPTDSEDVAKQAVAQEIGAGAKLIIAAGGDGTVGLVAREILGRDVALGLLPLGSVMNIARMLGVPRDLAGAATVIAQNNSAIIDVGEANGEIFFEDASVGIQAAVFRHADEWEQGDLGSVYRAVRAAFRYRPRRMAILVDDHERVEAHALMVTVSNAPYAGVGMTVAPDARLNDGQFDVVVWRHFSKFELFRHLAAISFGRRRYSPHTYTYRGAVVRIESERPLPARADANDIGMTPIDCRIKPQCLRVLVGPTFRNGRVEGDPAAAIKADEKAAATQPK